MNLNYFLYCIWGLREIGRLQSVKRQIKPNSVILRQGVSRWQCTSGWVLGKPVPLPLGLRHEFWNQMGVAESPCHYLSPAELLHFLMAQFVHLHKEDDSTYLAVMWGLQNGIPAVKLRATWNRCSGNGDHWNGLAWAPTVSQIIRET